MWAPPPAAKNYAWIIGITTAAILVVGVGFFWALLVYQGREIPRELILVVSGAGTVLTNLGVLFVGRQSRTNQLRTDSVSQQLQDGITDHLVEAKESLASQDQVLDLIREAMTDGARNLAGIHYRFDAIEARLIDRTARFERIEALLKQLQAKQSEATGGK